MKLFSLLTTVLSISLLNIQHVEAQRRVPSSTGTTVSTTPPIIVQPPVVVTEPPIIVQPPVVVTLPNGCTLERTGLATILFYSRTYDTSYQVELCSDRRIYRFDSIQFTFPEPFLWGCQPFVGITPTSIGLSVTHRTTLCYGQQTVPMTFDPVHVRLTEPTYD